MGTPETLRRRVAVKAGETQANKREYWPVRIPKKLTIKARLAHIKISPK